MVVELRDRAEATVPATLRWTKGNDPARRESRTGTVDRPHKGNTHVTLLLERLAPSLLLRSRCFALKIAQQEGKQKKI